MPARLTAHTELRGKLAKASSSAVRVPGIELPAVRLGGNFPHWSSYHPGVTSQCYEVTLKGRQMVCNTVNILIKSDIFRW